MFDGTTMFMALVFLAVLLGLFGLYSLFADVYLRDRQRFALRIDEEFKKKAQEKAKKSTLFKNLAQLAGEAGSDVEPRLSLWQQFELMVEQSGLPVTPAQVLLLCGGLAGLLGTAGWFVTEHTMVVAVTVVAALPLPVWFVHYKRRARRDKLLNQLPDALDLMSRIIRAGQTMGQAMQAIGEEFEQPISLEFAFCYEQQNLGLPPEMALRDLANRTGLLEVKIMVMALLVQQQTGGNLSSLLDNLANVIRERLRMRGKIRALTAEGRMQGMILMALPPLVFVAMLYINREYAGVLLEYPLMLIVMAAFMALGGLWIRKIVQFDF